MNDDQKEGTRIVIGAVTLIVVLISLSTIPPDYPMILISITEPPDYLQGIDGHTTLIFTKWFIAPLCLVIGYGVARYLGVVKSIFKKKDKDS